MFLGAGVHCPSGFGGRAQHVFSQTPALGRGLPAYRPCGAALVHCQRNGPIRDLSNTWFINEHLNRVLDSRWPPDYTVSKISPLGICLGEFALWCMPWIHLVSPAGVAAVHSMNGDKESVGYRHGVSNVNAVMAYCLLATTRSGYQSCYFCPYRLVCIITLCLRSHQSP